MAKAGRKGYEEELKRKNLLSLSYKILEQALKSEKVSDAEKRRIALELIKRRIPNSIEHSGEVRGGEHIIIIRSDKTDESKTEGFSRQLRVQP